MLAQHGARQFSLRRQSYASLLHHVCGCIVCICRTPWRTSQCDWRGISCVKLKSIYLSIYLSIYVCMSLAHTRPLTYQQPCVGVSLASTSLVWSDRTAPQLHPLQLLLADYIHFSCCSLIASSSACYSSIASSSAAASRLCPLVTSHTQYKV